MCLLRFPSLFNSLLHSSLSFFPSDSFLPFISVYFIIIFHQSSLSSPLPYSLSSSSFSVYSFFSFLSILSLNSPFQYCFPFLIPVTLLFLTPSSSPLPSPLPPSLQRVGVSVRVSRQRDRECLVSAWHSPRLSAQGRTRVEARVLVLWRRRGTRGSSPCLLVSVFCVPRRVRGTRRGRGREAGREWCREGVGLSPCGGRCVHGKR